MDSNVSENRFTDKMVSNKLNHYYEEMDNNMKFEQMLGQNKRLSDSGDEHSFGVSVNTNAYHSSDGRQQCLMTTINDKDFDSNCIQKQLFCQKLNDLNINNDLIPIETELTSESDENERRSEGSEDGGIELIDEKYEKVRNGLETNTDIDSKNGYKQMVSQSKRKHNYLMNDLKLKEFRLLEKWGESIGIYDTNGCPKRIVWISELNNYFELKLASLYSSDYMFYCSLINSRYPRFYTSTVNYCQRWRMRYNIFVDKILNNNANQSSESVSDETLIKPNDTLLVHIGEIHLYFDIIPKYCQPVYVNSSFYLNKSSIADINLDESVVQKITKIVNSIRYSEDIFQFKFPVNGELFLKTNDLFDKFMERQMELIEETIKLFRKNEQKKRKFKTNWNQNHNNDKDFNHRINGRQQKLRVHDNRQDMNDKPRYDMQNNYHSEKPNHNHNYRPNKNINRSLDFGQRKVKTNEVKDGFEIEWNDSIQSDEQNCNQTESRKESNDFEEKVVFDRQSTPSTNTDRFDYRSDEMNVEFEANYGFNRKTNLDSCPFYQSNIDN